MLGCYEDAEMGCCDAVDAVTTVCRVDAVTTAYAGRKHQNWHKASFSTYGNDCS